MTQQQECQRKTVREWLRLHYEWRIPVYQRHYAWNSKSDFGPTRLFWKTVEKQTKERLEDGAPPKQHYLGAVIVDNKNIDAGDGITYYDVVDGQQRLTTIQIALFALARVARDDYQCDIWEELKDCVLYGEDKPRLRPTNYDNHQFKRVLFEASGKMIALGEQDGTRENAVKSNIVETCGVFVDKINEAVKAHAAHAEPREVIHAILASLLDGFDLVRIVLRQDDDAQRIFESLNSNAQPLTTFDLIRNNVFRRAAEEKAGLDEELFNSPDWQRLEKPYWEGKASARSGETSQIDAYIARMLVAEMKEGFGFNRNEIFQTYKRFVRESKFASVRDEIQVLGRYVSEYRHLDSNPDGVARFPKKDCGVFHYTAWKNRDFYPVLFSIVGSDATTVEEKERMMKLLESYIIRRGVCGFNPKHYNISAVTICDKFKDGVSYANLRAVLHDFSGESVVFPKNEDVEKDCVNFSLGESNDKPFLRYVFKELEHHLAGDKEKRVVPEDLNIDHILPQAWERVGEWKAMLKGEDHDTIQKYIHTIGNLAPMSKQRNSKKSNRPWSEVKDLLHQSPMTLNRELAKQDSWGVKQIKARSEELARAICEIWPYDIS